MDKRFDLYLQELLEWNAKFNLTSITDPAEIRLKHFEDSLSILKVIHLKNESMVDVGSGAGFPGIPLKIACPDIKLTLIESKQKKVEFLKHLVKLLKLNETDVIWGRAEDVAKKKREVFDLAVSRALARLNVLAEYCLPLVKVGGFFVAYKAQDVEAEAAAAKNAIRALGGNLKEINKIQLPDSNLVTSLVIIEKIAPTPPQYPRRPGLAKQRPLK